LGRRIYEEYFKWLANGQPKKYLDALKEKVERVNIERIRKEEKILAETFYHKGLNLEYFKEHLTRISRKNIFVSNFQLHRSLAYSIISPNKRGKPFKPAQH